MKFLGPFFISVLLSGMGFSQNTTNERSVGGPCDRCEAMFEGMPSSMSWETRITTSKEPGEPMIIRGVLYKNDRKTPAPNVILYVYHTDQAGEYSPASGQKTGTVHGHLRGWMKTDTQGRYQFRSIRPGAYPSRNAPQHIHAIVKEPSLSLYWVDEYVFDDDPLLTEVKKTMPKKRGGSGIIHLTKNSNGEWVGQRDIILGLNIPGY